MKPEDLTDDDILDLQIEIIGHVFPASGMAHTEMSELWHHTQVALTKESHPAAGRARAAARALVAAAINARMRSGSPGSP